MVKSALATMWTDTATIYQYGESFDETTGRTSFGEVVRYEDVPCKLSFQSTTATGTTANVATVAQSVKVFMDTSYTVPAGCKIVVTRGDRVHEYKSSGEPSVFHNHQEIALEKFDGWA